MVAGCVPIAGVDFVTAASVSGTFTEEMLSGGNVVVDYTPTTVSIVNTDPEEPLFPPVFDLTWGTTGPRRP